MPCRNSTLSPGSSFAAGSARCASCWPPGSRLASKPAASRRTSTRPMPPRWSSPRLTACRSSGSSIPAGSTPAAHCPSSSGCSRSAPSGERRPSLPRPVPAGPPRMILSTGRFLRVEAIVPASSARWRRAVTVAFALGGITISAWGPRLPGIKAGLGLGTGTLGLLPACVTVGSILGLLGSTPLLHRLGGRRAILAALLLIAASLPLVAFGFVTAGAGIGALDVLINVEGAAVERVAGRTLMPRMHAAWSVGAAVGSGIGAACAALGISPAAQLIGEAVVIVAAAWWTTAAIPPGNHAPADAPARDRPAPLRHWLHGWLDWRLLLIGLVMLGVELGEGSANSWLTLAVRTDHGQSAAVAALFFTAFAAGEALTRIFAGPVVDRLGRTP